MKKPDPVVFYLLGLSFTSMVTGVSASPLSLQKQHAMNLFLNRSMSIYLHDAAGETVLKAANPSEIYICDAWKKLGLKAKDIGIGADGTVWVVALNADQSTSIYKWDNGEWKKIPGEATSIAVDLSGNAWVVAPNHDIYKWTGEEWVKIPGEASDIGIGAHDSIWMIGYGKIGNGGYPINHWTGSEWNQIDGLATRISVDVDGSPWIVNSNHSVFQRTGNSWKGLPGYATDIGAGGSDDVWIVGTDDTSGGHAIYQWKDGNWVRGAGVGLAVAVGPDGVPWTIDPQGNIQAGA